MIQQFWLILIDLYQIQDAYLLVMEILHGTTKDSNDHLSEEVLSDILVPLKALHLGQS